MTRDVCPHENKEVELTWFNQVTGPQHSGGLCGDCAKAITQDLSKYPVAYETLTIIRLNNDQT